MPSLTGTTTGADLDVSIHFNAYNTQAHGTECCYKTQDMLAQDIADAIASCGFTNRGKKYRSDLKFLNATAEPAILIETCFCDNNGDCATYEKQFETICTRIAQVLTGEGEEEIEEVEPPIEIGAKEPLFYARGKCSYFGGPEDMGVSASEGLAFIYAIEEKNQHLFLPLVPKGTTGLARRLNAKGVHYIACRWDYSVTPKEMLASQEYVALVRVPSTGLQLTAWPSDWGPHEEKTGGRVADLSPALMADLELETDDEVEVIFPWEG